MSHNNDPLSQKRKRSFLLIMGCILVVAGIIFLKNSVSDPKPVSPGGGDPSASSHPVAVPDTTVDPGVIPQTSDTVESYELPDTLLGRDKRSPYEAGYEDGYAAGCDDGATGKDHATYDETSNFATSADRHTYTEGYREGYAKGVEDGKQGKQFNI